MASSGSITTGTKEGRSVTLSWSLSSQDIANNTSTIAWTLKGSGSGSGWVMSGGFKAVINGTTVYSTSTDNRIQLYNGTVIASGSLKISHNADGTKSFKLSCEAGVYSYAVNVSASGTHTLNTIPRASSVSATSVNIGSATTISISRASSSFTHTLSYTFGSAKGTRLESTGLECHARTINELVLQDAVVKAINQMLGDKSSYQAQLQLNIASVIRASQATSVENIDEKLMALQQELIQKAQSKEAYDEIADEIFRLRELRQQTTVDTAARDEQIKRINDLQDYIAQQTTHLTEFDESLVRRWIKQITIWDDHITVELKSGVSIDVDA